MRFDAVLPVLDALRLEFSILDVVLDCEVRRVSGDRRVAIGLGVSSVLTV